MRSKKNGVFPPSFDRVMDASIRRLTSRAMNWSCFEDSGDSVFPFFFGAHTRACLYTIFNFWELYVPWKMWYRGKDIRRDISHNRVHRSSNMTVAHPPNPAVLERSLPSARLGIVTLRDLRPAAMYRYWGQTTVTQIPDPPLLCFPPKFTPRYVFVLKTYLQRLEEIE